MKDYIISFGSVRFCRNSKYLQPGDWFVCEDMAHLKAGIEKKPAGVILARKIQDEAWLEGDANRRLPQIVRPDVLRVWPELAVMRFPQMPGFIAGVTGTNGKTSTAYLAYKLLESLGCKSGYIGTLGVFPEIRIHINLTSPDAAVLHEILDTFVSMGITHVCIEISSSALDRHRVDQLPLDIGVWTSFSQEHLDIHQTMERYWQAKVKISTLIKQNGVLLAHTSLFEKLKASIESVEDEQSMLVLQQYSCEKYGDLYPSWSKDNSANFMSNNLEAAGRICEAAGFRSKEIRAAIMQTNPQVPGRMQIICTSPLVVVDFAHTPDALERLLEQFPGDKILVFGCGGNRDPSKRKPMGAIAHRLATSVVVTDDNPRNEDPSDIRREIIQTCPNAIEITDRKAAIDYAIKQAIAKSMTCIIAGKGHEAIQIYRDEKIPFSDLEVAKDCINHLSKNGF